MQLLSLTTVQCSVTIRVCQWVCVCRQELDSVKRSQKQQASSQSANEVRLNQAREDVQKYKTQLQKAQADAKVTCSHIGYIFLKCWQFLMLEHLLLGGN